LSDIFREVDEEVRRDKLAALWKKYGNYVIGAAAALVLGTAASVGWREYRESVRLEEAARYLEAQRLLQQDGGDAGIVALSELADDASTGYGILARLQVAAAQARGGETAAAVATYDALAADTDVDQVYRDLASLLAAMQLLEGGASEEVRRRIEPLQQPGSPWSFNAREIAALLALREGREADARKAFQALADDAEAPTGLRSRAQQMLTALGAPQS
jgi:hypothetical protein